MSQKCKLYPQDLITVFEIHSKMSHFWWVSNTVVCLARYVYKKVSWKSFIINLWKQRLVFAFFLLLLPCWEWFVGVGQYLSCVTERDYSLTGKSCLQLTWCLFAFVVLKRRPKKRWWWCFFALLQKSMNDPLHEENLHLNNDFLSDKKKESGLAQKPI